MINVSNEFREMLRKGKRNYLEFLNVTLLDGTELEFTNKDLWNGGFSIEDSVSSDNSFDVGAAIINKATFVLNDIENQVSAYDFKDAIIEAQVGLALDEIPDFAGKNIVRNSNFRNELEHWTNGGNMNLQFGVDAQNGTYLIASCPNHGDTNQNRFYQSWTQERNGIYTLSFTAKASQSVRLYAGPDRDLQSIRVGTDWERYSATFTSNGFSDLMFYINTENVDLYITKIKLEEGRRETVYSIAPEDVRIEKIRKGVFTADDLKCNGSILTLSCLDNMAKFDKSYSESKLGYPATLNQIVRDACSVCGVPLQTYTFPHDDFVVKTRPANESTSFREVISWAAQIAGCFCRCDAYGRLELKWFNQIALEHAEAVNEFVGQNLLRGTNAVTKLTSAGDWSNGTWRAASSGSGSRQSITIDNSPKTLPSIKCGWKFVKNGDGYTSIAQDNVPVVLGQTYTLSCYARCTAGAAILKLQSYKSAGAVEFQTFELTAAENQAWNRYSFTFVYDFENYPTATNIYFGSEVSNGTLEVCGMKLERGKEDTGYTIAYEDTSWNQISATFSHDISMDDVVITGIRLKEKTEDSGSGTDFITYRTGTDGYILEIEGNDLIAGGKGQDVTGWLGEQLIGLRFRKANMVHLSDPTMEAGDVGVFINRKGDTYKILFSSTKFTAGNSQTTHSNAANPAINSAARYSAATKSYVEWRKAVREEKTERQEALDDLKNRVDNSPGLFTTEERLSDGSTIFYMHDKPTLAESKIVWKMTAEAWGVSTDGGKTYNAGMTVDGDTIVRILNATGINADWINTGTIVAKNKEGETMFLVDVDTGQVQIRALETLEIGGRNLIRQTKNFGIDSSRATGWANSGNWVFTTDSEGFSIASRSRSGLTSNSILSLYSSKFPCKKDDVLTFSCWVKIDNVSAWDGSKVPYTFEVYNTAGTRVQYQDVNITLGNTNQPTVKSGEWFYFYSHHTVTAATAATSSMRLTLFRNGSIHIKKCKVEIGSIPTDWTPAPEDMATSAEVTELSTEITVQAGLIQSTVTSINNVANRVTKAESNIKVQANQIALTVTEVNDLDGRMGKAESNITQQANQISSTVKSVTTLTGRVSTAETTIKQQASEIELKVDQDGVIAAINLTPEKAKIAAKHVDISGLVTFSTLDEELEPYATKSGLGINGYTKINGGNILTDNLYVNSIYGGVGKRTGYASIVEGKGGGSSIGLELVNKNGNDFFAVMEYGGNFLADVDFFGKRVMQYDNSTETLFLYGDIDFTNASTYGIYARFK